MSVERIVADILGVPAQEIRDSSGPDQYPQWDSAAHIEIILSAEQEYGVTFAPEEMVQAISVGALRDTLRRKGARVE